MKKFIKSSTLAMTAALMMGASGSAFAHKVGVVDMQEVYKQIPQMAKIEQTLQAEFAERRQELEKIQGDIRFEAEKFKRESTTMSEEQKEALREKIQGMQKTLAEKGRPLEQEIKVRQNQELAKVQKLIVDAIESVAKKGKFDEVKVKDTTIYFNPDKVADLSDEVVKAVSSK
ncbi:OmpH family outer membrane protein [Pseudoalteromonas sp. McH1-7]|uniref:Outer membrane protein n=1 Tax=Pseudoalteromonas peptidolytica F12-50-A1 TaxID=1315280 RepID=A0A8I0T557_9GAMM|nr:MULTISPECIES: OmpH family outer membrane protein [Pseudoalteromonas]NUZ11039.1 OmpH family outer membrane protein [Pseudoalteromonas sp. McH1-7]MBE0345889.1 outer membrane protein [Pseudoalteromonas peptidolytica F12-50-A1]MDW7547969.1 OmpH family outer membrane protein [Pseudoalteromonas peptidolytica]NLR16027.1 OmpH family outer membrane protein [Pseudoalteromonas peptidolytica]RRS07917.1 OmpH family outer membrane protein [Pseudoalteromonas sp. J010]